MIKAIREHGFKSTPYPIILSIENHCNVDNQGIMANILSKELGELLYVPDVAFVNMSDFPSPEELKYKVIIKGKRLEDKKFSFKNDLSVKNASNIPNPITENSKNDVTIPPLPLISPSTNEALTGTAVMQTSVNNISIQDSEEFEPEDTPRNLNNDDNNSEEKETKVDTHPELSKYTSVGQNKVHSFKTQQDGPRPCGSCSSFSESKSVKFSKDAVQTKNWIAYNTKYIR